MVSKILIVGGAVVAGLAVVAATTALKAAPKVVVSSLVPNAQGALLTWTASGCDPARAYHVYLQGINGQFLMAGFGSQSTLTDSYQVLFSQLASGDSGSVMLFDTTGGGMVLVAQAALKMP